MSLLLKNFERMQRFMILFSRIFYFTICLFQKKLFILEIIREDFIRSTCPGKKKQVTILSYPFLEH